MKKFKHLLSEAKRRYDPSLSPYLVSTRVPGGDQESAPTGAEKLTVGVEALSPEVKPKLQKLLTTPERKGVQVYPNIGPDIKKIESPEEFIGTVRKNMARNLEWGVDRAYTLPELAERSQQWYVGAHNIAKKFSDKFNVPHHVAAAVIATQSPQKDWYQNVSLAERIMKVHKDHQNTRWTPEMQTIATQKIFKQTPEHQELLNNITGKTLGELTDPMHKAAWIRTFDEAHHPRHHRLITPEGEFAEHVVGQNGKRTTAAWGDFGSIAKGVRALESGGHMPTISGSLGGEHKVRSFYNNIIQPNTPKIITPSGEDPRDVTVDTHATGNVFARPSLAGSSIEVGDILGGAPASKKTGIAGTYPIAASAFRDVGDVRDIVPNAVQSVVWDERRATNASKAQKQAVDKLWQAHRSGELPHEEVLSQISKVLGKPKAPSWANTRGSSLYTSTFESVRHRASKLISESLQKRQK